MTYSPPSYCDIGSVHKSIEPEPNCISLALKDGWQIYSVNWIRDISDNITRSSHNRNFLKCVSAYRGSRTSTFSHIQKENGKLVEVYCIMHKKLEEVEK